MGVSVAGEQAARWRERMVGKGKENTPTCLGTIYECASRPKALFSSVEPRRRPKKPKKEKKNFLRGKTLVFTSFLSVYHCENNPKKKGKLGSWEILA